MNVNTMGEFLVVEPLVTLVDSMVMVGGVVSKVKVNGIEPLEAVLLFPTASVNLSAGTYIEHKVLPVLSLGSGVNVAI